MIFDLNGKLLCRSSILMSKRSRPTTFAAGTRFKPARKRQYGGARRGAIVPGVTRQAGYYGRYNRPNQTSEKKFFDGTRAIQVLTAAGIVLNPSLNIIVQGVTEQQRVGRKAVISQVNIRGEMFIASGANPNDNFNRVRLIVYCDKQTNGAAAVATDILETDDIDSFRNLENAGRFVILSDKTSNFNQSISGNGTIVDSSKVGRAWKFNSNINLPIQFSGATGAITEACCNNIGVIAWCGPFTTTAPSISYKWRLRYTD